MLKCKILLLGFVFVLLGGCATDQSSAKVNNGKTMEQVALIIGNSNYRHSKPLRNPLHDAKGLSDALRNLGFDVVQGIDLDNEGMHKALGEFSAKLPQAKVALFFYAGHGLQASGKNFMLPVDAQFDDARIVALVSIWCFWTPVGTTPSLTQSRGRVKRRKADPLRALIRRGIKSTSFCS